MYDLAKTMRIIFSRKGFDGASGGCPSPIIDGRPRSLPIPTEHRTRFRYDDLPDKLGELLNDVTRNPRRASGHCHLDPDLDAAVTTRRAGWRGAFGQVGRAQTHLQNQGVCAGDLFLFFGLFRNALKTNGRWQFKGPREHSIFGWLQIGQVVSVGTDPTETLRAFPWLEDHPHVDVSDKSAPSNTIYVACDHLEIDRLDRHLPGWGLFTNGIRLTAEGSSLPSVWHIPAWLNPALDGTGLTYNPVSRFKANGELQSPGRGQEFVADITGRDDALIWLRDLFRHRV
jgi:Nucleotide modification associated domain 3